MTAADPVAALRQCFERIGPTAVKHDDGRFGVLWFSGVAGRPLAVFPRAGYPGLLDAIRQPVRPELCFARFEDVADAGWRLD
jgi:hypothetical protein